MIALIVGLIGLGPISATRAQTVSPEVYLHGLGAPANPSILYLDIIPPLLSITKYRDAASVNFSGGNLWKVVGNWVPNFRQS